MNNLAIPANRLLPWEDTEAYENLHLEMSAEYDPQGPMERHLVEELAGCMWRMKRVSLAESALHRKGMYAVINRNLDHADRHALAHLGSGNADGDLIVALVATDEDTATELDNARSDRAMTERALCILNKRHPKAYEKALAALGEDTAEWWGEITDPEEYGEGDEIPYARDAGGLKAFLDEEAMIDHSKTERDLRNRPAVKTQICAETLNPEKHQALATYEAHLDRKLEKVLALLMKVQNTRRQVEN
jgi:hypothetical protein